MAFFDDLGKKVSLSGQSAVGKVREIADVSRLNMAISEEEDKINNLYYQIGKLYVNLHRADCEDNFVGLINAISESEGKIATLQKQIQDTKGKIRCAKCGAEIDKKSMFCSFCGEPIPKQPDTAADPNALKCSNCGASVAKGMRFCTCCGKPMQLTNDGVVKTDADVIKETIPQTNKVCPQCGSELDDDVLFCTECGTKL